MKRVEIVQETVRDAFTLVSVLTIQKIMFTEGRWNWLVNGELLRKKIDESGLKMGFIADKLKITHQSLLNRINGVTKFRLDEIQTLCELLHLSDEERKLIFFPENVGKQPQQEG